MIFVLAPDSFKESMSAKEACVAMEQAIKKVSPTSTCIHVPMADGGEGTVDSFIHATNGEVHKVKVIGPLGNEVEAQYGILGDGKTAIIEMASASGLHLVPSSERNPMITTSYGTGQLIQACLDRNVAEIIIGLGGSATNDGGIGAVQALGGKFLDHAGKELGYGGGELERLATIDMTQLDSRLNDVTIKIACDVINPLYGEHGAAKVFARQKGATDQMIEILDQNLQHYAKVIERQFARKIAHMKGAGAAGGLGAGMMFFLQGQLKSGIDVIIETTNLEEKIKSADFVFTGEGRIDFQTKFGKTPYGVSVLAKKYNKPVIAFTGEIGDDVDTLYETIDAIFSITNGAATLEDSLRNGKKNLEQCVENVVRVLK